MDDKENIRQPQRNHRNTVREFGQESDNILKKAVRDTTILASRSNNALAARKSIDIPNVMRPVIKERKNEIYSANHLGSITSSNITTSKDISPLLSPSQGNWKFVPSAQKLSESTKQYQQKRQLHKDDDPVQPNSIGRENQESMIFRDVPTPVRSSPYKSDSTSDMKPSKVIFYGNQRVTLAQSPLSDVKPSNNINQKECSNRISIDPSEAIMSTTSTAREVLEGTRERNASRLATITVNTEQTYPSNKNLPDICIAKDLGQHPKYPDAETDSNESSGIVNLEEKQTEIKKWNIIYMMIMCALCTLVFYLYRPSLRYHEAGESVTAVDYDGKTVLNFIDVELSVEDSEVDPNVYIFNCEHFECMSSEATVIELGVDNSTTDPMTSSMDPTNVVTISSVRDSKPSSGGVVDIVFSKGNPLKVEASEISIDQKMINITASCTDLFYYNYATTIWDVEDFSIVSDNTEPMWNIHVSSEDMPIFVPLKIDELSAAEAERLSEIIITASCSALELDAYGHEATGVPTIALNVTVDTNSFGQKEMKLQTTEMAAAVACESTTVTENSEVCDVLNTKFDLLRVEESNSSADEITIECYYTTDDEHIPSIVIPGAISSATNALDTTLTMFEEAMTESIDVGYALEMTMVWCELKYLAMTWMKENGLDIYDIQSKVKNSIDVPLDSYENIITHFVMCIYQDLMRSAIFLESILGMPGIEVYAVPIAVAAVLFSLYYMGSFGSNEEETIEVEVREPEPGTPNVHRLSTSPVVDSAHVSESPRHLSTHTTPTARMTEDSPYEGLLYNASVTSPAITPGSVYDSPAEPMSAILLSAVSRAVSRNVTPVFNQTPVNVSTPIDNTPVTDGNDEILEPLEVAPDVDVPLDMEYEPQQLTPVHANHPHDNIHDNSNSEANHYNMASLSSSILKAVATSPLLTSIVGEEALQSIHPSHPVNSESSTSNRFVVTTGGKAGQQNSMVFPTLSSLLSVSKPVQSSSLYPPTPSGNTNPVHNIHSSVKNMDGDANILFASARKVKKTNILPLSMFPVDSAPESSGLSPVAHVNPISVLPTPHRRSRIGRNIFPTGAASNIAELPPPEENLQEVVEHVNTLSERIQKNKSRKKKTVAPETTVALGAVRRSQRISSRSK